MCDELGDNEYMKQFVEEAGSTSLCSAANLLGCSDREVKFIEKMKEKGRYEGDRKFNLSQKSP